MALHWNVEICLWPDFWHFLPLRDAEAFVEVHLVTNDLGTVQQGLPINLRWLTRDGPATKLTIDPDIGGIIRFAGNASQNDVVIENDDYWLGNGSKWLIRTNGLFRFGQQQAAQQPLSALRWRFIIKSEGNRYESDFRRFEITRPNDGKFQIAQCGSGTAVPSEGAALAESIKAAVEQGDSNPVALIKRTSDAADPVRSLLFGNWILEYSPTSNVGRKYLTFNSDGTIGTGRNLNEDIWQMETSGTLAIWRRDGSLQNRFLYEESADSFTCTNDPSAVGIKDQTIYRPISQPLVSG